MDDATDSYRGDLISEFDKRKASFNPRNESNGDMDDLIA